MRSRAFLISIALGSVLGTGCSTLVGIEDATLRAPAAGAGGAIAGSAGSAGASGAAGGAGAGAAAGRGGSGGEAGKIGGMGGGGGGATAGKAGAAGQAGSSGADGGSSGAGNGGAGNGGASAGGAGNGGASAGGAGDGGASAGGAGNGGAGNGGAGNGGAGSGGTGVGGIAGSSGAGAGSGGSAGASGAAGQGGGAGGAPPTITSFGTGIQHACAARGDGSVWCWGGNDHGQLGTGTVGAKTLPTKVALEDIASIAVGITHTCALAKNGDLRCWGENAAGQCGLGFETPSVATPPATPILTNVSAVYSASRGTTCAVVANEVLCWGRRLDGQSSGGSSQTATPTKQSGLATGAVKRVSMGSEVGCALIGDQVQCWGRGGIGVGAGPGIPSTYFAPAGILTPTSGLAGVHVGDLSALAWTAAGQLFAWGGNGNKQLGLDGVNDGTPQNVMTSAGLDAPVVAAASGFRSSCAITGADRRVRCWGGNGHGQIGASVGPGGDYLPSKTVLFLDGGSLAPLSADAIDVGWEEACATSIDRQRLYCWGAGDRGQLGDGTIDDSKIAVRVALP